MLRGDELGALRRLLDEAWDDFNADAWEHALGGVHVLLRERRTLVGHVAVVPRILVHDGLTLSTGYVEALAVAGDRRRMGLASRAMDEAERVVCAAYELGALSDGTGIPRFYERRGWLRWRGPTAVLAPSGLVRTPEEDGSVLVLPTPASPELDLDGSIACDWRSGDVW